MKTTKNLLFLLTSLLLLPVLAWANVGTGKPNTGGSSVLVIWNSDGGWDAEIADTGSTCLYNLLTSTGAAYNAGVGFNFSVTTLPVSPTFNNCNCWATAASAIQNAVSGGTIQPLVNASGNPNYCIIFDMRFLDNSNNTSPLDTPGWVAGDTITQGDITAYQAYLAAGGSLFIMGDNYYNGGVSGFVTREGYMYDMINAVAATGIGANSDNILSIANATDTASPVGAAPYLLNTNYNNVSALTMTTDYPGPITPGVGSGKAWVVMPSDSNDVLVTAWSGPAGDLNATYNKGSMMYWGDSNVLQDWATSGGGQAVVSKFMENAITWLYNANCCTPPSALACTSGTAVTVTGGNPNLVNCFESGLNGWTGDNGTFDGTKSVEASGGSVKDALPIIYSQTTIFTSPTFTAGTLTPYEGICFEMMNTTGTTLTVDVHGTGTAYPNQITTTATVPSDGAWHNICLSFTNDYTLATNVSIYLENTTSAAGSVWLDSVQLQSGCSPNPMVADPNCCLAANTPTNTQTNTVTKTQTSTATVTNTETRTNTSTPTSSFTNTQTSTDTVVNTNTQTATLTNSQTSTATLASTATDTNTSSVTPTSTDTLADTATNTQTSTTTPTVSNTSTPLADTATNTDTPTVTNSQTNTNTPSDSPTSTDTVVNTYTSTQTSTSTGTSTATLANSATQTNTTSPTGTSTVTQTFTATNTPVSAVSMGKVVSETQARAGDTIVYSIAITITGNSISNPVVTDVMPSGITFAAPISSPTGTSFSNVNGTLTWTLPSSLAPGVYTLTYTATVNNFAPANVALTNHAQLNYSGGTTLNAYAPVTVIGNFSVGINIYNSAGEVIKTIPIQNFSTAITNITLSTSNTITTLQGPGSSIDIIFDGYVIGTWDGTNNQDQPVGNGTYKIQIDNVSAGGTVTSVSQNATVNRAIAQIEVDIFNEAGEVVRKLYNVLSNPVGSVMTNVTLSAGIIKPSTTVSSGSTSSAVSIYVLDSSTPVTLTWDGTNDADSFVTPGQYQVQVHWTDGKGNTTNITKTVMVLPSNSPSGKVLAKPNIIKGEVTYTTFDASSVTDATQLKIKLFAISGELIQTLTSATTTAVWTPLSGTASGLYVASVEVDNANGGLLTRQNLKILILH